MRVLTMWKLRDKICWQMLCITVLYISVWFLVLLIFILIASFFFNYLRSCIFYRCWFNVGHTSIVNAAPCGITRTLLGTNENKIRKGGGWKGEGQKERIESGQSEGRGKWWEEERGMEANEYAQHCKYTIRAYANNVHNAFRWFHDSLLCSHDWSICCPYRSIFWMNSSTSWVVIPTIMLIIALPAANDDDAIRSISRRRSLAAHTTSVERLKALYELNWML